MISRSDDKDIIWWGSSHRDVLAFPAGARRAVGFQLGKVQAGLEPDDWKSFEEIGSGAREIRIREDGPDGKGIFRVLYVAKFDEALHVLHCFRKTTQATSGHDKRIAAARYRAMIEWRRLRP